ncbi:MAG: carboxylating nicotinate-nucleotide diphosphorylase [Bacteroidales bacterium]|nr:carboxylating nicotinate-nucleotide diphosphorylase [Bacteroidales bacterium]
MTRAEAINKLVERALEEDLGDGDHSSLACIPGNASGKAHLLVKGSGILAGVEIAATVFKTVDKSTEITNALDDGSSVYPGDTAFIVEGPLRSLLKSERLVLNIMQRMSGIATSTRKYAEEVKGYRAKILDTRKTNPGSRIIEKEAVRIGGGVNHRMGLYDMIMLKDNHIDYAGGIEKAIRQVRDYLEMTGKKLDVVVEARNMDEVNQILTAGMKVRIMLDNFSISDTRAAVEFIRGRAEVESSGGITLETVRDYASCGVDYISVGAITHQIESMDLSLKAI